MRGEFHSPRPLFYARDKRLNIFGIVPILFMALFTSEAQARFYWRGRLVRSSTISTGITGSFENPYFLFSFFLENIEYFPVIYIFSLSRKIITLLTESICINIVVSLTRVDRYRFHKERIKRSTTYRRTWLRFFLSECKKRKRVGGGREKKGKKQRRWRERRLDS